MQYGRTILELLIAQALILATCVVSPFNFDDAGRGGALVITSAFSAAIATVLFIRHRNRGRRELQRKLQHLRESAVA